jgi:hypothetical protein
MTEKEKETVIVRNVITKQSAYGTAGKAEAQAEGHGILKINLSLAR